MDSRWLWVGGLTVGALAIGGIAYAASSSPAPATGGGGSAQPLPAAPSSPAPGPGPTPTSSVPSNIPTWSDLVPAASVGPLQDMFVALIRAGMIPGTQAGPFKLPIYDVGDVDGNPNNAKFRAALSIFQKGVVAGGVIPGNIPTDGTLDYATGSMILVAYATTFGWIQTPQITDPASIAMAQYALARQNKVPNSPATFPIDGTQNPAFTQALSHWQQIVQQSSPKLAGMRTDGILDAFDLATVLVQAYLVR